MIFSTVLSITFSPSSINTNAKLSLLNAFRFHFARSAEKFFNVTSREARRKFLDFARRFFWILQTKKTVKRKRNGKGNFEILLHAKRGNNSKMSPCAKREENFGILQMKRTIKKKRNGENNISRF